MSGRILVVDDERRMAEAIEVALSRSGHRVETASSAQSALAAFDREPAEVVITDWRMPGMDGLALLKALHQRAPRLPVILITAYGEIPTAVAAMREGAFDYVTKPFDNDELRCLVSRALDLIRLERENDSLRAELAERARLSLVAESPAMKGVLELVDRVARSRSTVLIQGDSGTGKELIARRVHALSDRFAGPFVAVNCKAFAESLLESELFGHEAGAFTGAISARAGCFERASGGTLFLDEIGEISLDFQAKLLRVLQESEVQRVGGGAARKVDSRIIAATNRDLRAEAEAGRFREDLYFRLAVIPVSLSALAARREDILPLAKHFLSRHADRSLSISREAEAALLIHDWPGNVRELENAIERATVLARGDQITPEDLLLQAATTRPRSAAPAEGTLQSHLDRAAADRIRAALAQTGGKRVEAAELLGIERTTLYRLIKRLEIV